MIDCVTSSARSRSNKGGFTLIEMLVVFVITTMLGLVLVAAFTQSRAALSKSATRLDVVGRARRPVDRAIFYISSSAVNNGIEGVVYPQMSEPGIDSKLPATWPRHMIIQTTENFADTAYSPNRSLVEYGTGHYMFSSPPIFLYALWFEGPDSGGVGKNIYPGIQNALVLARLHNPGLDRSELHEWARTALDDASNVDDDTASAPHKVIASDIEDIAFRRVMENGIQMRVETRENFRDAAGQTRVDTYVHNAVIQIPALTLK